MIKLNDGSIVSGAVTDQTELECIAPAPTSQSSDGGGDGGDGLSSNSGGDDGGTSSSGDDDGGGGDDDGNQMCTTAALTNGTPVAEANLEISSNGATWDSVELVTASASSSDD
jgi:hypothetical protein